MITLVRGVFIFYLFSLDYYILKLLFLLYILCTLTKNDVFPILRKHITLKYSDPTQKIKGKRYFE